MIYPNFKTQFTLTSLKESIDTLKQNKPKPSTVEAKFLSLLSHCVNDSNSTNEDKEKSFQMFKLQLIKLGGLPKSG